MFSLDTSLTLGLFIDPGTSEVWSSYIYLFKTLY